MEAEKGIFSYDTDYYASHLGGSERSAHALLPILFDLVSPKSVVDVGCGAGAWLRVCADLGIQDYLGIDSDAVPEEVLRIPCERLVRHDLTRPLSLDRRFDLVLSLEVAEHLPEEYAHDFVRTLTLLGDLTLFSAAIPYQEGEHHVNLQWPDYWESLFATQGYRAVDAIRVKVWNDDQIPFWYRQNAIVFLKASQAYRYPELLAAADLPSEPVLRLVHSEMYTMLYEQWVSQSRAYEADTRINRWIAGLLPRPVRSGIGSLINRALQ